MSSIATETILVLDHAGLTCRDLDAAVDFYHGLLGMPLLARGTGMGRAAGMSGARVAFARLAAGAPHMLELLQYLDDDQPMAALAVHHAGAVHVAFGVTDLTAVLATLAAHGVEPLTAGPVVVTDPDRERWHGARLVYVRDPDGHTVELVQFTSPST